MVDQRKKLLRFEIWIMWPIPTCKNFKSLSALVTPCRILTHALQNINYIIMTARKIFPQTVNYVFLSGVMSQYKININVSSYIYFHFIRGKNMIKWTWKQPFLLITCLLGFAAVTCEKVGIKQEIKQQQRNFTWTPREIFSVFYHLFNM